MSRNAYPGPCYRCGDIVEAGKGFYERVRDGSKALRAGQPTYSWLTQHAGCTIVFRGTKQLAAESPLDPQLLEGLRQLNRMKMSPELHSALAEQLRDKRNTEQFVDVAAFVQAFKTRKQAAEQRVAEQRRAKAARREAHQAPKNT